MYTVVVIDDDVRQAEHLASLLARNPHAPELDIVACVGGTDLADLLKRGGVDIALLDIHLGPAAPSGIDIAEALALAGKTCEVIYVSGYLEYISDAYRTAHAGFLPKPVEQDALDAAIERALANLEATHRRPALVRVDGALVQVLPQRIMYVESNRRKVLIHTRERVLETYSKMVDVERELSGEFVRCHKSFLVNMDYIAELRTGELTLFNGEVLPVSQRARKGLRERFLAHVGRSL